MKQLHPIQLKILKKLLFSQSLRYSEVKPSHIENNRFDFHLDQLIKEGYIQKGPKYYSLTNYGKEYANRMDTKQTLIMKQAKISAWICCTRRKNSDPQFLVYTRLKQPFYGCQGFMSGKVNYGEKVVDAAKRELKEETNLEGHPRIVSLKHYIVFDKNTQELVEDKFMILCLVENPQGVLKPKHEGKYKWVNEKDLKKYVTNHFESYSVFQKQVDEIENFKGQIKFEEICHHSIKF